MSDDKGRGRADFQVSSYDRFSPDWSTPPDTEFEGLDRNPTAAGEFVWTGFDYLGEPTPYNDDYTILENFSDPEARTRAAEELASIWRDSPRIVIIFIRLGGVLTCRWLTSCLTGHGPAAKVK